ncbi:MAG: class I SAM-dependent methyltransferase [Acidiferrobacterales bacterium]
MARSSRPIQHMYDHFSEVAASYNKIRTTDLEPILYIKSKLEGHGTVDAVDIGCGGGRYSLLLLQHIPRLHLICNDVNASMVAETTELLRAHGIKNFSTIQSDIAHLTLRDSSLDCILTFNAIHHFDPTVLLEKATRALRADGYVFVYTRLRSQNARSIWGQFFPGFSETEERLYSLSDVERWGTLRDDLTLESVETFRFKRCATLSALTHQAHNKHYSTFSLYSAEVFDHALEEFERRIRQHFSDKSQAEWFDENVMVVLKKSQ